MQEAQVADEPVSVFSSIRISLIKDSHVKALASCLVGGAIMVTGIRVVEGRNGVFVSMPQRRTTDGNYQDITYPVSKEIRAELQRVLLDAFSKASQPQPALA
jgi:stage V sporulation protein G